MQQTALKFCPGVIVIRSARSGRVSKSASALATIATATLLPALWFFLQIVSPPLWAAETPATALLEVDNPVAREGYFVLSWEFSESASSAHVLQQSTTPDFRNAVNVPVANSGSLTLTGYTDGFYYFRVGSSGQWSPAQEVRVAHHSLSAAMTWFTTGALLFLVLATTILTGAVRSGREKGATS